MIHKIINSNWDNIMVCYPFIIKKYEKNNFKELIPPDSLKTNLSSARSLNTITTKWIELLSDISYTKISK